MHLQQHRIRNLSALSTIADGTEIVIALTHPQDHEDTLKRVGFDHLRDGDQVLPDPAIGPVCDRNANGWPIVHRDQPMETAYRQRRWRWTEFHGKKRIEREETRDVPYKRYPRTHVPPPSVELTMAAHGDGLAVVTEAVELTGANEDRIVHIVNLMLELFGECDILDAGLDPIVVPVTRRLNWEILPQGELPWERTEAALRDAVERAPQGNRPVIWERLRTIAEYSPTFTAVGRGGFTGYVIFGFPDLDLYVLESAYYGNATYVLAEDWERLSTLTKAELLADELHEDRLIHRAATWPAAIRTLLERDA